MLRGLNDLLSKTFFNGSGDPYFDVNKLYCLSTRKQLGGNDAELLNSGIYLMKNLEFNENFDASVLKNNNLLYLLGLRPELLKASQEGSESFQDVICEKFLSRNDRIINMFDDLDLMQKSFISRKIAQINSNLDIH